MSQSPTITLTTDLGSTDYYAGALKGYIVSHTKNCQIIDITHEIESFNISKAAFVVKNAYQHFPKGSVHLVGVSPDIQININNPEEGIFPVAMEYDGHFFVGTDNGFFSLLTEGKSFTALIKLENYLTQEAFKYPLMYALAPAACEIINGTPLKKLGVSIQAYKQVMMFRPITNENLIKGTVIHIDKYGNIITNIHQNDFNKVGKNQTFTLFFRRKEYYIDKISQTYSDVAEGEKLAFFNSAGLLEIAINKGTNDTRGGANSLFGIDLQDIIRLEFYPPGSKETIESLFD